MILTNSTLQAPLSKKSPKLRLGESVFNKIHTGNLVYNTCWEDPRCDRQLLELDEKSRVVMITSAGCNALDYALDRPAEINCVDMNPRQNALLNLKLATFEQGSSDDLFQLFGAGLHTKAHDFYQSALRPNLPQYAQAYWDKNMDFFVGKGIRKSFYWHSTSGLFAYLMSRYMKFQKKNYRLATQLFEADSLDTQRDLYFQLEKKVLNNFVKWAMSQHLTLCLLGIPNSQQNMIKTDLDKLGKGIPNAFDTEGGKNTPFIQRSLRHVFTQLPISDNYFWQLYFYGKYPTDCRPNYLKSENFDSLKQQTKTIKTHNTTITNFLQQNPAPYSHYVLLDHQDWLATHDRPALVEEWRAILDNSRIGTRILLRSAADSVDFFPSFIHEKVKFEREKTVLTHQQDRVGTYGSVHLGIVSN